MPGGTFNGLIQEFPGLGVDKFNTHATHFLLTHFHSDHLEGLSNKSFVGTVYCSEITKSLLKADERYAHVMHYITALEVNKQHKIHINNMLITLILIPAYHCSGAVLFLVKDSKTSVLCTGDLKADRTWLQSFYNNPFIFPYTTRLNQLETIYLDTTFGRRSEPYIEMPSNFDGIQMAISLLKSYPLDDQDVQFKFMDRTFGFEEVWIKVVNSFSGSLQLDESLQKRFELAGLSNSVIDSNANPKFHVSDCGESAFVIKIKQCIDFNAIDFVGNFCPIRIASINPTMLKLIRTTRNGHKIYDFKGRNWILPKGSNDLLPDTIKLIFSRHSSYSECCKLISKLRPRQVWPCSDNKDSWLTGFQMSRLFGRFCDTPQPPHPMNFDYDVIALKKWGPPASYLRDRPVKTVNRWDLQSCKAELQIAKSYLKAAQNPHYKFKGQHWVSKFSDPDYNDDDELFDLSRKKDMQLQDIVAGRGDRTYRKIIEKLQKIYNYRNLDQSKELILHGLKDEEIIQGYSEKISKLGSVDQYNYNSDSLTDSSSSAYISNSTYDFNNKSQDGNLKIDNPRSNSQEDTDIEDTDVDTDSEYEEANNQNDSLSKSIPSKQPSIEVLQVVFKKNSSFNYKDEDSDRISLTDLRKEYRSFRNSRNMTSDNTGSLKRNSEAILPSKESSFGSFQMNNWFSFKKR